MKIKNVIKARLPYSISNHCWGGTQQVITKETHLAPKIYNKNGDEMVVIYLQDRVASHSPYSFSAQNVAETNHILWDRYNKALPIHCYSHNFIRNAKDFGEKNLGILVESEAIMPTLYDELLKKDDLIKKFDVIFTHSDRLLNKYNNARFIPGSCVWYGGTMGGGKLCDTAYLNKTKNVSIVSSNKSSCYLHDFRMNIAKKYMESALVDVFGTVCGGNYVPIYQTLEKYRYSIVVENMSSDYYFTEKLLNCFASMTIPIYVGARKIDQFFNECGIIRLSPNATEKEIDDIILGCSEDDYKSRKEAIVDNYNRCLSYLSIEDYIFENYREYLEV